MSRKPDEFPLPSSSPPTHHSFKSILRLMSQAARPAARPHADIVPTPLSRTMVYGVDEGDPFAEDISSFSEPSPSTTGSNHSMSSPASNVSDIRVSISPQAHVLPTQSTLHARPKALTPSPPFVSALSPRTGSTVANRSIIALLANDVIKTQDELHLEGFDPVILQEKDKCTALIHLYRAEVGRLAAYRTRLDNTTNWCISMVGVLSTFSISQLAVPHYFFGLILLLITFFLFLESRRYLLYDFVKHRARLMEVGFFNQCVGPAPSAPWEFALHRSYIVQIPRMSLMAALTLRLKRVYFVLYLVVYLAWVTKVLLLMHSPSTDDDGPFTFPYAWFSIITTVMLIGVVLLIKSFWETSNLPEEEDLDV